MRASLCQRVLHGSWGPGGLLVLVLLASAGCGQYQEPQFRLNFEGIDRSTVSREQQQGMVDALVALFGTPDNPYVVPEMGLDLKKLQLAAGPVHSDQQGKRSGLYRKHCVHCHGISGDGAGPTAVFLYPYPRDYRKGVFKFTSTGDGAKPTTQDLRRTLVQGINGTSMPSFALLPDDEIDALVEYVRYLSLRGEAESLIYDLVVNQEEALPLQREMLVGDDVLALVVGRWTKAPEQVIAPPERPEGAIIDTPEKLASSVEKGRVLFFDEKRAKCYSCHGPAGLGDGGDPLYDVWNEGKKGKSPAEVAALWTLPIQELKPRNLRLGIYRGGRRPLDLYRRIHAGIKGANMPAAGGGGGKPAVLSPEEIWHLVDYVRSLPFAPTVSQGPADHPPQQHASLRY